MSRVKVPVLPFSLLQRLFLKVLENRSTRTVSPPPPPERSATPITTEGATSAFEELGLGRGKEAQAEARRIAEQRAFSPTPF